MFAPFSRGWVSTASKSFSKNTTDEAQALAGRRYGADIRRDGRDPAQRDAQSPQAHRLSGYGNYCDVAVSGAAIRGTESDGKEKIEKTEVRSQNTEDRIRGVF